MIALHASRYTIHDTRYSMLDARYTRYSTRSGFHPPNPQRHRFNVAPAKGPSRAVECDCGTSHARLVRQIQPGRSHQGPAQVSRCGLLSQPVMHPRDQRQVSRRSQPELYRMQSDTPVLTRPANIRNRAANLHVELISCMEEYQFSQRLSTSIT